MRVSDCFFFLPAPHVRVHHFADDWPRPDDGHLHHQIIEFVGVIARQRCHLRTAFHLKHTHCIRTLQGFVYQRILRQLRQVDGLIVML